MLRGLPVTCPERITAVDFLEEVEPTQQPVIFILVFKCFNKRHIPFLLHFARCLLKDERQRWSAEQLMEHQFVKSPVEHGLSPQRSIEEKQVRERRQRPFVLGPVLVLFLYVPF